jgi:hypothetical protein
MVGEHAHEAAGFELGTRYEPRQRGDASASADYGSSRAKTKSLQLMQLMRLEILVDADRGTARGELEDSLKTLSKLIGRPTTTLAAALAQTFARSH